MNTAKSAAVAVPPVATDEQAPPPPPAGAAGGVPVPPAPAPTPTPATIVGPPVKTNAEVLKDKIAAVVSECISYSAGKQKGWAASGFIQMGDASTSPSELAAVLSCNFGPSADVAWVTYRTKDNKHGSCVLKKTEVSGVDCGLVSQMAVWTVCLDHRA